MCPSVFSSLLYGGLCFSPCPRDAAARPHPQVAAQFPGAGAALVPPPRLPTSWLGGGMGLHLAALWYPDAKLLGPKNVILLSITEKNQTKTG